MKQMLERRLRRLEAKVPAARLDLSHLSPQQLAEMEWDLADQVAEACRAKGHHVPLDVELILAAGPPLWTIRCPAPRRAPLQRRRRGRRQEGSIRQS